MRKLGQKELSDERILGSGNFVGKIIKEADTVIRYQLKGRALSEKVDPDIINMSIGLIVSSGFWGIGLDRTR